MWHTFLLFDYFSDWKKGTIKLVCKKHGNFGNLWSDSMSSTKGRIKELNNKKAGAKEKEKWKERKLKMGIKSKVEIN